MILKLQVPIGITKENGYDRVNTKLKDVEVRYIKRRSISRNSNGYYYEAHYELDNECIKAYNESNIDKTLAYTMIVRDINKKFNPKKLVFENNICKL